MSRGDCSVFVSQLGQKMGVDEYFYGTAMLDLGTPLADVTQRLVVLRRL
jgi:hypothetical protein